MSTRWIDCHAGHGNGKQSPLKGAEILVCLVENKTWEQGRAMKAQDYADAAGEIGKFYRRLQRLRACFGKEADRFLPRPTERLDAPIALKRPILAAKPAETP